MPTKNRKNGSIALEARYTNYIKVGHNAVEFIFDLGQYYSTDSNPFFHTRIVAAPLYAKRFSDTLRKSIEDFESTYGLIKYIDRP